MLQSGGLFSCRAAAVSCAEDELLAVPVGSVVRLYRASTGDLVKKLVGHSREVTAVVQPSGLSAQVNNSMRE
jgi:hypothetical protein